MPRKALAEMSADNAVLRSEISRLPRGTDITFAEHFTRWLGRPIRTSKDLRNFGTVVNAVRNDYGLVLSTIRGVGYRILLNEEVAADESGMHRMRRQARRIKKSKATVDLGKLTAQQVQTVVAQLTIANVVESAAKTKNVERLAASVNGVTQALPAAIYFERMKANL